ncbi:MAG: tetratricopeptide repeat-containing protein, partial [Allosphingosinicella sp.]
MTVGSASLSTIVALTRAGATARAWEMLEALQRGGGADDASAFAVRGRLLKDQALGETGAERRRLYHDSAAAYRRSAELRPATYPLINAASLSLLGGDGAEAGRLARQVLERIEAEPDEPETPYWRAATRAEALLLLGRHDEARAALAGSGGFFGFLNAGRRAAQEVAARVARDGADPLAALDAAIAGQVARERVRAGHALGAAAFGRLWRGEETDPSAM